LRKHGSEFSSSLAQESKGSSERFKLLLGASISLSSLLQFAFRFSNYLFVLGVNFLRRLSGPLASVLLAKGIIFSLFSLNNLLDLVYHILVFVSEDVSALNVRIELSLATLLLVLSDLLPDIFGNINTS
jgi:hypothetical protein